VWCLCLRGRLSEGAEVRIQLSYIKLDIKRDLQKCITKTALLSIFKNKVIFSLKSAMGLLLLFLNEWTKIF
jgi:hypothetical protein